jgi:predicted permease
MTLFRKRLDDRLDEEMQAHLEFAAADFIARGMSPDEARAAALRSFGGVTQTREAWRETYTLAWLDTVWQDLRYAVRSYRKTPGFTLAALVTLTLAIGANTAIFSLLNALVLRDLPVHDPATLVQVGTLNRSSSESYLTLPMFRELAARQQVFSSLIGYWGNSSSEVDTGSDRASAMIWPATGNVFAELGIRAAVGRLLTPGDMSVDPPSAASVAVIGHTFWERHLAGDAAAIGRTIRIDGAPFTIVGVAPAGFTGLGLVIEPDVTIPLTAVPLLTGKTISSFATSASPGVTLEQVRAHLATLWPDIKSASVPPGYAGPRREEFLGTRLTVASAATGIESGLRRQFAQPLWIVMGIAFLILVLACVNLASLLLSRGAARSHEIGVRLALGASRWRVARQMLTEGVLLAIVGGACGVVFAFWACRAITAVIFEEMLFPVAFDGLPDARVISLTTIVAVAAGLLFSVVPAWRIVRRQSSTEALQQNTRSVAGTGAAGKVLVAAQVALSLVLVANAGLLVRSLALVRAIKTGVERTNGVIVAYPGAARLGAYDGIDNDSYYQDVLQRIGRVPGVHGASVSLLKPAGGSGYKDLVAPIAEPSLLARGVESTRSPVSPGFFEAVGIPLMQGRDFDWSDRSTGRRVTILSESLARRLFGDRPAVGQHVRVGLPADRQDVEVIGVAADARLYNVKEENVFAAYTAALQDPSASFKCFVVRGTGVSYPQLRRAVEELGRERVGNVVTLRYITDRALLQERLTATLSGFFGALALLLAGVGVFGLMSYAVAQRRREIGIRMALGANPRRMMILVVRDGLAITLAGVVAGFVAALATAQLVRSLLFGVTPHDPVTLLAAPAFLVLTAMVACWLPARRAARVDPMIALRAD